MHQLLGTNHQMTQFVRFSFYFIQIFTSNHSKDLIFLILMFLEIKKLLFKLQFKL
jgi:hypothetical protein